nr:formimidoylglutamate deiminase [Nakamurella aerolata]
MTTSDGIITAITPLDAGAWHVPSPGATGPNPGAADPSPGAAGPTAGAAGAGGAAEVLDGMVFPGFADAHSHVFHRALRGRTHTERDGRPGDFFTWREQMYALAAQLDPDLLHRLARATYAELLCAGYTAVGEFHYLHHQVDGTPYPDPNLLGLRVAEAADQAGIGLTLLDTLYLAGGFGVALQPPQRRFSDGSGAAWAARVRQLGAELPAGRLAPIRLGLAAHSVRAVPPGELGTVAGLAAEWDCPVHLHLSEQLQENRDSLAATGKSPTALAADAGLLGSRTSVVHATHLTDTDVDRLGAHGVTAVICPTTEADLADGLPDLAALTRAGVLLACGGDQQVTVDPFAQARLLEYGERLRSHRRGNLAPAQLVAAATEHSHRSIGSAGGRLVPGAPADLVCVRTDSVRTAGSLPQQLVMAAGSADVQTVVVGGHVLARNGFHRDLGDPGPLLADVLGELWERVAAAG